MVSSFDYQVIKRLLVSLVASLKQAREFTVPAGNQALRMFFLKKLRHTIQLHPSYFGPALSEYLQKQLKAEVEGTCSGSIVSGVHARLGTLG